MLVCPDDGSMLTWKMLRLGQRFSQIHESDTFLLGITVILLPDTFYKCESITS